MGGHVLVIPYPAQGHVSPLMKLAHRISDHGIKVTFVTPESIHARLMAAMPDKDEGLSQMQLVSIPDPWITYVVADTTVGWALEVAKKMGIEGSALWPAGPVTLAMGLHIPKLIEAGIIDSYGNPIKSELIRLSKDIPAFSSTNLSWNSADDPTLRQLAFEYAFRLSQTAKISNWLLCNSFYELDSSSCDLIPNVLTLGPLLASNRPGSSAGNLWPNDPTCISWLDKQPAESVIYVAFGSTTFFKQKQFNELALGIELVGRPFLWVVPSVAEYPNEFTQRVSEYGKIVGWADQEKVLAHPSVACFFSHCGWNSTMESLCMGVPFICWPHTVDQLDNRFFICDIWKVGLGLDPDENGLVSRHQIKTKIENLLSDDGIKENALRLKEMARRNVCQGGSSANNFKTFIEALQN
ncbi:UDP-glycosyltransferase 83A1-like isoform X2 [Vitis riparia]|uniref:UDP-glycosyltransferase 83A1-like isoform X2 n=1 Tax=Vitis riparia TaxID=96939 RepID=UPI00155A2970|nr:UDP-glycosyltransferase 83A1-like isoform X2 [Vitis riparia]